MLVEPLSEEQLNRVYTPILSPLAWDLGHIGNFEELWLVQRVGGLEPLRGQPGAWIVGAPSDMQIKRENADDQPAAIVADIVEDAVAAIERDVVGEQRAHRLGEARMRAQRRDRVRRERVTLAQQRRQRVI